MAADTPAPVAGKRPAVALFLFTVWQSFLTSGVVYGWTPLLIILKKEGVYQHRCPAGIEECNERDVALNLMFTIGSICMILGGIVGGPLHFPKFGLAGGGALVLIGSLMLALAPADADVVYPIAYALQGFGGGIVHFEGLSIGALFGPHRGYIMSCLAGVLGFSSMVYQIGYAFYLSGASRETIFLVHAALVLANMVISLWFWPVHPFRSGESVSFHAGRIVAISPNNPDATSLSRPRATWKGVYQAGCSTVFVSLLVFVTCQLWFNRCLMGMYSKELDWKNEQLEEGSKLDVDMHLTLFNMSQAMLGSTMIPFFGMFTSRFGHRSGPLFVTGLLALVWNVLILIPAEWPLYILYFFAAWHRQFLMSAFMTFITSEYPPEIFGALLPVMNIFSGCALALQNPILSFTLEDLDGNFYPLLIFTLVLGIALACSAGLVFLRERRAHSSAEAEKQQQKAGEVDEANEERADEQDVEGNPDGSDDV